MQLNTITTNLRNHWRFVAVVLTIGTGASWVLSRAVVAYSFSGTPVTVDYVITQFDMTGSLLSSKNSAYALRSDGSTAEPRTISAPDGSRHEQVTIQDVKTKKRTVIEGITKSITTYMLSDRALKKVKTPVSKCIAFPKVKETHLGQTQVKNRIEWPNSHGGLVLETWYAPDLGCPILSEKLYRLKGSTSFLLEYKNAVSIKLGEPDAALFEIPLWTERLPSEVDSLFRSRFSIPPSSVETAKGLAAKDQAYLVQQVARP